MAHNNQIKVSGLHIVSTPIGNMGDITLRALETLKNCDLLLCEDTRVTKKLLNYHGINAKTESYNDINAQSKRAKIIEILKSGQMIALVSDAGTPLISDPGFKLVRDVRDAGISVFPIPGASSPIAALSACGLPTDSFVFHGFFDSKKLGQEPATAIYFESAKRLLKTLQKLDEYYGDCEICVAREITKLFEDFQSGTAKELIEYYTEKPAKGEVVILVSNSIHREISDEEIANELEKILKNEKLKKAAELIAGKYGISKKRVYEIGLKHKQ